jgi:hypothetical protein
VTLPRYIVLDTNLYSIIGHFDDEHRHAALARIQAEKREGARFVLSPTVMTELGATHKKPDLLGKLVDIVHQTCDVLSPWDTYDLLRVEVESEDPFTEVNETPFYQVPSMKDLQDALAAPEVKEFFATGMFGYDQLRHALDPLDRIPRELRRSLTFKSYLDWGRIKAIRGLLEQAAAKGRIARVPDDLEGIWTRSVAWRFLTTMLLATEFRRIKQIHKKGEGCMTDLRVIIDSAYAHEVWTADQEFAACGSLAKHHARTPRIELWDPRPRR